MYKGLVTQIRIMPVATEKISSSLDNRGLAVEPRDYCSKLIDCYWIMSHRNPCRALPGCENRVCTVY